MRDVLVLLGIVGEGLQVLHDASECAVRLLHVLLVRLAKPADLLHEQLLVMKSVALLLGEVRLGRLELVDDLVALLGDRLAYLEHSRDLGGALALGRNRVRRRRALPTLALADDLDKDRLGIGRAPFESMFGCVALTSLRP